MRPRFLRLFSGSDVMKATETSLYCGRCNAAGLPQYMLLVGVLVLYIGHLLLTCRRKHGGIPGSAIWAYANILFVPGTTILISWGLLESKTTIYERIFSPVKGPGQLPGGAVQLNTALIAWQVPFSLLMVSFLVNVVNNCFRRLERISAALRKQTSCAVAGARLARAAQLNNTAWALEQHIDELQSGNALAHLDIQFPSDVPHLVQLLTQLHEAEMEVHSDTNDGGMAGLEWATMLVLLGFAFLGIVLNAVGTFRSAVLLCQVSFYRFIIYSTYWVRRANGVCILMTQICFTVGHLRNRGLLAFHSGRTATILWPNPIQAPTRQSGRAE